jgi:hypothetical protein
MKKTNKWNLFWSFLSLGMFLSDLIPHIKRFAERRSMEKPWIQLSDSSYMVFTGMRAGSGENSIADFVLENPTLEILNIFPVETNSQGAPFTFLVTVIQGPEKE